MQSKHNRKFTCSGVALVFGATKNKQGIVQSREICEALLVKSGILEDAPFLWIGLIYRYGIKNDLKVNFKRIHKKYGDLSMDLELNMEILMWADQINLDLLLDIYVIAALEAFIQVCKKYKLPDEYFRQERAKYGDIPETVEECIAYRRKGTEHEGSHAAG